MEKLEGKDSWLYFPSQNVLHNSMNVTQIAQVVCAFIWVPKDAPCLDYIEISYTHL